MLSNRIVPAAAEAFPGAGHHPLAEVYPSAGRVALRDYGGTQ